MKKKAIEYFWDSEATYAQLYRSDDHYWSPCNEDWHPSGEPHWRGHVKPITAAVAKARLPEAFA